MKQLCISRQHTKGPACIKVSCAPHLVTSIKTSFISVSYPSSSWNNVTSGETHKSLMLRFCAVWLCLFSLYDLSLFSNRNVLSIRIVQSRIHRSVHLTQFQCQTGWMRKKMLVSITGWVQIKLQPRL